MGDASRLLGRWDPEGLPEWATVVPGRIYRWNERGRQGGVSPSPSLPGILPNAHKWEEARRGFGKVGAGWTLLAKATPGGFARRCSPGPQKGPFVLQLHLLALDCKGPLSLCSYPVDGCTPPRAKREGDMLWARPESGGRTA